VLALVLALASGGGRLAGCSSPAVPAWRLKVIIGRELQLRQISKNAASSKQPGSPHLCFSEAWSWRWLATRGGEAEADTNSCKSCADAMLVSCADSGADASTSYREIHLIRRTAACSPYPPRLEQNPLLCALPSSTAVCSTCRS
jgi:hypothetical protein